MRGKISRPLIPPKRWFGANKRQNGPFLPEGFVLQFWNFAWDPKSQNMKIPMKKILGGTLPHPQLTLFWPVNGEIWGNRLWQMSKFEILQKLLGYGHCLLYRCPGAWGYGLWSGNWPYPPLGAVHSFSFSDAPRKRSNSPCPVHPIPSLRFPTTPSQFPPPSELF